MTMNVGTQWANWDWIEFGVCMNGTTIYIYITHKHRTHFIQCMQFSSFLSFAVRSLDFNVLLRSFYPHSFWTVTILFSIYIFGVVRLKQRLCTPILYIHMPSVFNQSLFHFSSIPYILSLETDSINVWTNVCLFHTTTPNTICWTEVLRPHYPLPHA